MSFEDKLFESGGNMLQIFGFGYSKGRGITDEGQFDESGEIDMHQVPVFLQKQKL